MVTTGELRKNLAECFFLARDGKLSGDALRGVIGCANQINSSLAIETKIRAQNMREGIKSKAFGKVDLA